MTFNYCWIYDGNKQDIYLLKPSWYAVTRFKLDPCFLWRLSHVQTRGERGENAEVYVTIVTRDTTIIIVLTLKNNYYKIVISLLDSKVHENVTNSLPCQWLKAWNSFWHDISSKFIEWWWFWILFNFLHFCLKLIFLPFSGGHVSKLMITNSVLWSICKFQYDCTPNIQQNDFVLYTNIYYGNFEWFPTIYKAK